MTLNQYIKLFTDIASAHNMVKSFGVGQIHEYLDSEGTADLGTNLFLEVENSNISGNVITDKFTLYCMDYVNKDLTNRNEVLSDTKRILEDVLGLLHNPIYYDNFFFDTATDLNIFYDDKLVNEACGWYCVISLKNDFVYDSCQIPLTGIPITSDTYAVDCSPGFTIGVPSSRTLTINGVTYDLSADRTWTISTGGVPTSRILTINGVSYDLSADRSWIVTGGGETLAQTLAIGNSSGTYNIVMDDDHSIVLGSLAAGSLKYDSGTQRVILANNSGGQSIQLTDIGGIFLDNGTNSSQLSLASLTASRVHTLPDADGTLICGTIAASNRIAFGSGTANQLTDSANLTYDGTMFKIHNAGTNGINFQGLIGTTTSSAIYINQATPSATNYTLFATAAGQTVLNGTDINFRISNNNRLVLGTTGHFADVGQGVAGTSQLRFTVSNKSSETAGTNVPKVLYTLGTLSWATGALTAADFYQITQPSVLFTGASTATLAATMAIVGAPIGSTNATVTTSVGLLIKAGAVNGAGTVTTSYGAYINAPTGAGANHALGLAGNLVLLSGYIDGRIKPRVTSIVSDATPTINTDNCDAVTITALATNITSFTTNLSGTPNNFDKLMIRIKDDGTARTLAFGASFEAKGVALPTTTVISKVLTIGFVWDSVTSKWGCVSSAQEV